MNGSERRKRQLDSLRTLSPILVALPVPCDTASAWETAGPGQIARWRRLTCLAGCSRRAWPESLPRCGRCRRLYHAAGWLLLALEAGETIASRGARRASAGFATAPMAICASCCNPARPERRLLRRATVEACLETILLEDLTDAASPNRPAGRPSRTSLADVSLLSW